MAVMIYVTIMEHHEHVWHDIYLVQFVKHNELIKI